MNEEQKQVVFRYIVSRDITVDLAIEIFDHMTSQIHDLMDQGENFDEAFETVRETWHEDLKVNPNLIFAYNKSRLNWRMKWNQLSGIFNKSLFIGAAAAVLAYGISFLAGHKLTLYVTVGMVILYMIYHFVKNFQFIKSWSRLRKKYDRYTLSVYDEGIAFIPLAIIFPQLFFHTGQLSVDFNLNTLHSVIYIFMLFFLFASAVYAFLSMKKLKESRQRIESFVKYLHPNRFYAD